MLFIKVWQNYSFFLIYANFATFFMLFQVFHPCFIHFTADLNDISKECINSLFKQSRLESYFASGVAGDAFVLAVEFDLVVVQLVFARENGIDDLLAGNVLYLSA